MAKIVYLSKYPPIEGGIAAKAFWLAKALGKQGHEIHIVTDRLDTETEYSHSIKGDGPASKNVFIHRPQGDIPWHIPNDNHRAVDLLDLAVQVIRETNADVIDTGYLIPYGLIGYLASQVTGVPFLLRHGGSDIQKFVKTGIWNNLIKNAFENASLVITDKINYDVIQPLSNHSTVLPPYVPDPSFFYHPDTVPKGQPILALIGKANYHWRHKGWHRVIDIMKHLRTKFKLVIVSQGIGIVEFRKYVEERIDGSVKWKNFVHPLKMPALFHSINGIFYLCRDLPFPVFSNLILETVYCGKTVITDQPDLFQTYGKEGLDVGKFSPSVGLIPGNDPESAARIISDHFLGLSASETTRAIDKQDYQSYIRENEKAILSVL